ncbi:MAG: hypothetical protein M3O31_04400 [Acidobacteriota bacterium]|nr:hypothetical protein [Acidobacteriota bacterium]
MFEIIGLAFATLLLFVVAAVVGCVFAGIVWLIVRTRQCHQSKFLLIAGAIPIASAAYLWICVASLPGETLFGDISEKLPNGYSLQGLGKMPDFAEIVTGNSFGNGEEHLPQCVDSLQVIGPLVVGKYSHPPGTFDPAPLEPYFIFNTQTGQHIEFNAKPEVEKLLGRTIQLVPSQSFQSGEESAIRQRRRNKEVMFCPPILLAALYLVSVFRLPRDNQTRGVA